MRTSIILLLIAIPLISFSQRLKLRFEGRLLKTINQSSGLAKSLYRNCSWTVNDAGHSAEIYLIGSEGDVMVALSDSSHLDNTDWEDLTEDSSGLLIGDFGNNNQMRKNLVIYIVNTNWPTIDSTHKINFIYPYQRQFPLLEHPLTIHFHYPDQRQFPPLPSNWNFDCEAFFHHNDSLYLFSKNLSNPNDGFTKVYRLSDQPGDYTAELIDSFYLNEPVTSADISPDKKTIVLLTYFSLWVFKDFPENNFLAGKAFQFPFRGFTQKEAIRFVDNSELFITDERHFGKGGKLYQIDLRQLNFSKPVSKYKKQIFKRAIYNAFNNPKAKYKKITKRQAAQ